MTRAVAGRARERSVPISSTMPVNSQRPPSPWRTPRAGVCHRRPTSPRVTASTPQVSPRPGRRVAGAAVDRPDGRRREQVGRAAPDQERRDEDDDAVDERVGEQGAASPGPPSQRTSSRPRSPAPRGRRAGRAAIPAPRRRAPPVPLDAGVDAPRAGSSASPARVVRTCSRVETAGRRDHDAHRVAALRRRARSSSGSSRRTVPAPTSTASAAARIACTRAPALGRRDPARVAAGGSDLAVEADGRLEGHERQPSARELQERPRSGARARVAQRLDADVDRRRRPRAGARSRVPSTSGLGSCTRDDRARTPAATIASVQGGVRPWWQQGSSVQ